MRSTKQTSRTSRAKIAAFWIVQSVVLTRNQPTCYAFSAQPRPAPTASNNSDSKRFIEIVDLNSPLVDRLPASMIESWSTWILDESGSFSKIPDSDGFVQPSSVNELFQPLDLKPPQFRLALGLHVREGTIRHIMPALDICFEGGEHRNRGMCSVPRAFRWIGYNHEMLVGNLQDLHVRAFQKKQSMGESTEKDNHWTELGAIISGVDVANTLKRALYALAETAPDELGAGSNVIHALIEAKDDGNTLEYPGNGHELCLVMDDRNDSAHPEEYVKGKLQVAISAAMAGSESQYLPDAYKPLYEDVSLRNPRYEQFRGRRLKNN